LGGRGRPVRQLAAVAVACVVGIVLIGFVSIIAAVSGGSAIASSCETGAGAGGLLPTPPAGQLNAGQMVRYFVQAGESPDAAAGIVGNLIQESGDLNPNVPDGNGGGGLAQWNITWYHEDGPEGTQSLDAFAAAHHLAANTDQAQLAFIVYDLRTGDAFYKPPPSGTLQSNLQSAADPETAATMFETGYEGCSGVTGWMAVIAGSLCDDAKRRNFAREALQQAHLGAGAATTAATSRGSDSAATTSSISTGTSTATSTPVSGGCSTGIATAPITQGPTGKIEADGVAEAPANAPPAVKQAIAAGNAIIDTFYSQERRLGMLTQVQDSYDCSGSTDFVLWNAGLADPPYNQNPAIVGSSTAVATSSSVLVAYGQPGPGKWITAYSGAGGEGHEFIEVAGLVLDTSHQGLPYAPVGVPYHPIPGADYGPSGPGGPTSGPRWFYASQILTAQLNDGLSWTARHPQGL
jgi:hypothetical protein